MAQKVYLLEQLDCANCAAKIEAKLAKLPGVEEVTVTFATKQMRLTAQDPDGLLPEIQRVIHAMEPEVQVVERKRGGGHPSSSKSDHHEHHHEDEDGCGCGHDHHHEHHHEDENSCGCGHDHHEHHHEDEGGCGCGHDHHHEHHHEDEDGYGCGHDHHHEHHHEDEDSCGCGHDHHHEHHHEDEDSCGCGHDHHHNHSQEAAAERPGEGKTIFLLENLGCANCAAKMESRISALPGVKAATITFATKQLRLSADHPEELLPQIQEICTSVESEVRVVPLERRPAPRPAEAPEAKKSTMDEDTKSLIQIIVGAALFLLGKAAEITGAQVMGIPLDLPLFVVAYLVLGLRIVVTAAKNLTRGQVFDENFLMSIATLGAFVIREYPEAVGVMLFYRIGELFEHKAVEKSRGQIMDAVDLRPEVVNRIRGEAVDVVAAEDVAVGDLLLVRPGDRIPLDGVIVDGESRIDTSPITGEPVPIHVAEGAEVTSGCVNLSGQIKLRVEKPLEESMVTRILDSVENAAASKPKIDRFITRFARIYTPVVVLVAIITAVIPSLVTGNWNYWVYTALSFLVMSCPCAVVLSVPLAFFSGIGAGSKRGILFKGGVSIEALSEVKAVVMDKTGTITKGNFVLQEVRTAEGMDEDTLLTLCASSEQTSTHPIASSIVAAARERDLPLERVESLEEIPGHGIRAVIGGREVLCGNGKLMERFDVRRETAKPARFGAEVLVAVDGRFAGDLVIADTLKEDAKPAIARLNQQGIVTAMLTGDTEESAQAVAEETGIREVHAKLLPQDKLSELKQIRAHNGAVMFVGDGINDAPVLAGADVGAAMGSGADAAIEAADVVFMTSAMEAIPQSISIARKTNRIAKQNVIFALVIKIAVMLLGLCGYASMWMAVFADTGVTMLCILNSIRILYRNR